MRLDKVDPLIKILIIALTVFLIVGTFKMVLKISETMKNDSQRVTNYEECVAAGNPVLRSVPGQCTDKYGNTYIDELSPPERTDPVFNPTTNDENINKFQPLLENFRPPTNGPPIPEKPLATSKEKCDEAGGTWKQWGLLPEPSCKIPTSDAGISCNSSSECESTCIQDPNTVTSEVKGVCYKWDRLLGECYSEVENGEITIALCID